MSKLGLILQMYHKGLLCKCEQKKLIVIDENGQLIHHKDCEALTKLGRKVNVKI